MKISLLCIGKTADGKLTGAMERYLSRIPHYVPFAMRELPDVKNTRAMTADRQKEQEGRMLMSVLQPGDYVVLLDERGKEMSSREFASYMEDKMISVPRQLVFVIGGPYGFSKEVYGRADFKISMSRMTFSHEMARLFFIEQLYRAMTILKGEPYHHD